MRNTAELAASSGTADVATTITKADGSTVAVGISAAASKAAAGAGSEPATTTAAPGSAPATTTAAAGDASAAAKAVADAAAKAYTAAGCDKDATKDGCAELEKVKAAADAKVADLAGGNSASDLAASIAAVLVGAIAAMSF